MMFKLFSLLFFLLSIKINVFSDQVKEGLHSYLYETSYDESLNYQAYFPKEIKPDLPIVLFLHGAGERGDDNQIQSKHVIPQLIKYIGSHEPCLVLVPQCPKNQKWANVSWKLQKHRMQEDPSTSLKLSLELLNDTIKKYNVNKKRVYIVGLSMGGYGTWDAIQRKPDFFATAIPICGGGDVERGASLIDLPIWAWHGDLDTAVPVYRSRSMIEAIRNAGGSPKYTELKGVGHDAWTPASESEDLWDWLFSQKKK